ncbi:hypothetical protein Tcan_10693 [Toxocara canis]|uniref:G_PROTEIN_RECEP_F1_2 domain-containing protein n=1 Tax=Toxocara canis TaxID=6265 RepID=A0A0B2VHW7_TOXCA|nr:hypothetical protein Tcan_10693 [Toxocara canis]
MRAVSVLVLGNDVLTTVIGLSANIFVIVLCFKAKTIDSMKARIFIGWRASVDFTMAVVYTALQLGLTVNNSYITVLIYGPAAEFPTTVLKGLCTLLLFLFNLDLVSLSISIVYRYSIICGHSKIQLLFKPRNLPILVATITVVAASFASMMQSFFTYSRSNLTNGPLNFMGTPIQVGLPDKVRTIKSR